MHSPVSLFTMPGDEVPPVAAAPISFAAAALKEGTSASAPLRVVQLDGQVVLKIAKHCTECAPALVTGQLLGLDVGQTLEVTDSFPFPVSSGGACSCASHRWDGMAPTKSTMDA